MHGTYYTVHAWILIQRRHTCPIHKNAPFQVGHPFPKRRTSDQIELLCQDKATPADPPRPGTAPTQTPRALALDLGDCDPSRSALRLCRLHLCVLCLRRGCQGGLAVEREKLRNSTKYGIKSAVHETVNGSVKVK